MSKQIFASEFQAQIDAADATTDFKAIAQAIVATLVESEAEVAELQKQIDESDVTAVTAERDEALATVKELGIKLDLQEKTRDQEGIVVAIGDGHKLLIGKKFRIEKKEYTAEDVANTPKLLDYLVSKGSGSLVEIPEQTTDGLTN